MASDEASAAKSREPRPDYRADIDGLRAVAVLLVVSYHAFPGAVPGGFTGVDVFFVISGFLISSILFEEARDGRVRFLNFYARRVRRIFPALVVVLAATLAAGLVLSFPDELRDIGRNVFGGAAFVSNLLLARGFGYFEPASEANPLLHLWSLGVEEQFYILWPFAVAALGARPRAIAAAVAVVMLASFALSMALSYADPRAAFFSPFSRFWELMVGACLAAASIFARGTSPDGALRFAPRTLNGIAAGGALFVALGATAVSSIDPFPGWRGLLPSIGALLLIAAGPRAGINAHVLAHPAMVFVGRVSYPFYLWHWPMLVFLRMAVERPGALHRCIAIAAAFALAWATYRWIEKPLRFGPPRARTLVALAFTMAALGVLGLAMKMQLVGTGALTERAAFAESFDNTPPRHGYMRREGLDRDYGMQCDFYDIETLAAKKAISVECTHPSGGRSVLVWGDSHAQGLAAGLRATLPHGVHLLQVATSACPPSATDRNPDPWGICNHANRFALGAIAGARPDVVILAQADRHRDSDWNALARAVLQAGARHVLVVGPLPQWDQPLPKIVARYYWPQPPARIGGHLDPRAPADDAWLERAVRADARVHFVSVMRRLCDRTSCLAYVGNDRARDLIAFDQAHLTRNGAAFVARETLWPALDVWLARP